MVKCIFCNIASGEIKSEKIYENLNFFSIKDVNPLVKGHSLVISKRHFETIFDIPNDLGGDLIDCLNKTSLIILKENKCDGLNIIQNNYESAGQIVKHVHFHLIPRKKNDGLKGKMIF
jgi:histidine triad (HIT) family protein